MKFNLLAAGILPIAVLAMTSHSTQAAELPIDSADVAAFVMPVSDSPRARRYMATFDRAIDRELDSFDVERGLMKGAVPDDLPTFPPGIDTLDRHERKRYMTGSSHYWYRLGRNSSSAIGAFGRAWGQLLSKHYHSDAMLAAVRAGFEAFIANQAPSGEFVFCPLRYSSIYGTHEMSWRLENFIVAYAAVKDALTPEERERYSEFLRKAMSFLRATPCDHICNRGMVWLGVMSMCWRATDDPGYLDDARRVWTEINRLVFIPNGQVYEGHAPDLNYSPISYEYLIRFRLMTEDESLDSIIDRSTRWLTEIHTEQWYAFAGFSTRYDLTGLSNSPYRLLMGYEMFADRHPEYATLAEQALDYTSEHQPMRAVDHGGAGWITAAYFHRPKTATGQAVEPPEWFTRYTDTGLEYYTVNRGTYRTMVTLAGIPERKGLQTWAATGSVPFIAPDKGGITSTVRGFGLDLASRDIGDEGWSHKNDADEVPSLTAASDGIASAYLFSPSAAIVIHLTSVGKTEAVLAGDPHLTGGYRIFGGTVVAATAAGTLHVWGDPPEISEDGSRIITERTDGITAYAFAANDFALGTLSVDNGVATVSWTDSGVTYRAVANLSETERGELWCGDVEVRVVSK